MLPSGPLFARSKDPYIMTNGRLDRLAYRTIESSQRSLVSDAESDVGSLLSGLSQARQIPNRRSKDENKGRSKPKPANERSPRRREKPTAGPPKSSKNHRNNEKFKQEITKIIKIQAFARGYIQRFAYQSQLTMEKTKKRFFAIQIQAFVRGCLQRKQFHEEHGKKRPSRSVRKESTTERDLSPLSLGSPKPIKKSRKPKHPKAKPIPRLELESDSERSEISSRLERLTKGRRDRVKSRELLDEKLGESESEVGSIISNLSQARRVPDRRRKREDQEKKAIKIQALARGYIQRFLFRSMIALENTRKKYAAMSIQAYSRGYLQRKNGPQVSRSHVAPHREPLPETKVTTSALMDHSSGSSKRRRRRQKVSRRDGRRDVKKKMKKPRRRHSDSEDSDVLPPRELTIRKPIRHCSDSDNESDVPPRQPRPPLRLLPPREPQEAHTTDSQLTRKEEDNGELTDEELRKLLKPDPAVDEVIQLVKRNFAHPDKDTVEVLKDLDSYDDRNFWMKIGGVDHLVKIHNGVESLDLCRAIDQGNKDSVIHFQYEVMKILADNGISASRPVLSHKAQNKSEVPLITELPVVSDGHSPCKLALSVFSWVPGNTMADLKMLPVECLADAGSFLGILHQKLDTISVDRFPAAGRYHQWDGKNTADLKDFLHCIKDDSRRSMINSILEAFESDLIESGVASTFRKSVNHADFNGKRSMGLE